MQPALSLLFFCIFLAQISPFGNVLAFGLHIHHFPVL